MAKSNSVRVKVAGDGRKRLLDRREAPLELRALGEDRGGEAPHLLGDEPEALAPLGQAPREVLCLHRQRVGKEGPVERRRDDVVLQRRERHLAEIEAHWGPAPGRHQARNGCERMQFHAHARGHQAARHIDHMDGNAAHRCSFVHFCFH